MKNQLEVLNKIADQLVGISSSGFKHIGIKDSGNVGSGIGIPTLQSEIEKLKSHPFYMCINVTYSVDICTETRKTHVSSVYSMPQDKIFGALNMVNDSFIERVIKVREALVEKYKKLASVFGLNLNEFEISADLYEKVYSNDDILFREFMFFIKRNRYTGLSDSCFSEYIAQFGGELYRSFNAGDMESIKAKLEKLSSEQKERERINFEAVAAKQAEDKKQRFLESKRKKFKKIYQQISELFGIETADNLAVDLSVDTDEFLTCNVDEKVSELLRLEALKMMDLNDDFLNKELDETQKQFVQSCYAFYSPNGKREFTNLRDVIEARFAYLFNLCDNNYDVIGVQGYYDIYIKSIIYSRVSIELSKCIISYDELDTVIFNIGDIINNFSVNELLNAKIDDIVNFCLASIPSSPGHC